MKNYKRIAIAGRDRKKLEEIKNKYLTNKELLNKIDIVIASSNNDKELDKMCSETKVLLTTVGPYKLYSEPLVRACISNHTIYVDITGETNWVEKMRRKYSE